MGKINSVVIVGGGSAGWMSAATFIKYFPNKEITVIESKDHPTVSVGESTLGFIRKWTSILEIDEQDFMKYTNASYKLSIKFTDFYEKDRGSFHYPFGQPHQHDDSGTEWQIKKVLNPETEIEDYCRTYFPAMPLIENNKISTNKSGEFDGFDFSRDVAYHFDSGLFGSWLKEKYCIPRGVNVIQETVETIETNEDGIEKLLLSNGTEITADLFIDCTGFKSLLLKETLKEPFDSYSDMLPNNRAWATQIPYTDKDKELESYTNCTAIENGWVWNIPLWNRIGTGYVYSDNFVTPEKALEEFKAHLNSNKMTIPDSSRGDNPELVFKDIHMRIGIHNRTWVKNVVAIGLSAGFIEPLESNGLLSVHEFLLMLMKSIDRPKITQLDKDCYNMATKDFFDGFFDFVALHYKLSIRDDTEYWKSVTSKSMNKDNKGLYNLRYKKYRINRHEGQDGIQCISIGMDYLMMDKGDIVELANKEKLDILKMNKEFIQSRKLLIEKWNRAASNSPLLSQYLKQNIYN